MMNYIWVGMVVIAVVAGGVTGKMDAVLNDGLISYAQTAVDIAMGLIGIMAFFCGLMRLMEKAGICDALGRAIAPAMRKLFPEVPADHPANSIMALYIAANMLGIGDAATPIGLKAMQELQTLNKTKDIASRSQAMLLAMATTSVTLLPTTAIAMRASVQVAGSAEIVVPTIIATIISTITGIFFTFLFDKTKRWNYDLVIEREIAAGTIQVNPDYIGPDPIILPDDYVPAEIKDEEKREEVEKEFEAKEVEKEAEKKAKKEAKEKKEDEGVK